MRVLFFSITAGEGHNQVARVLSESFEERGAETKIVDTFEFINSVLKETISHGYLMSTKTIPIMYDKSYRWVEKRDQDSKKSMLVRLLKGVSAKKVVRFIGEYKPDVIICTHVFPAAIISAILDRIDSDIKRIGIVTDFTMHPYWEETSMDYYVTPTELLNNQAEKKGLALSEILPIGIPINPKFANKTEKAEAKKILGLDDKKTIMVMSGSMGCGKVGKVVKQLDQSKLDFQIVSICGYNKRLKKKIDNMELNHKIYNYGFVDTVDLFMDASECIITKPGGLTTSEALAKGLPIIIANPLPGHENRNVEFFLNNGAALLTTPTFPIDEALYQLFSNKTRLKNLQEVVSVLGKPHATKSLVDFCFKLVEGK